MTLVTLLFIRLLVKLQRLSQVKPNLKVIHRFLRNLIHLKKDPFHQIYIYIYIYIHNIYVIHILYVKYIYIYIYIYILRFKLYQIQYNKEKQTAKTTKSDNSNNIHGILESIVTGSNSNLV